MHQNTIRLVFSNPETFAAPWADGNELCRGNWILSARADNLQVLHYYCRSRPFELVSLCAEGRYLVAGTDRSGPYVFEDFNFPSAGSKFKYKKVNGGFEIGFGEGDSPIHACGVHGMIVTDMYGWLYSPVQTTYIQVANMNPRHGRDVCDDESDFVDKSDDDPDFIDWEILWGEIDEDKTEDVDNIFASDGIIVASFTNYYPYDPEADYSSDGSFEEQDEGISYIRIWDLTVSSIASVQKIISELNP